MTKKESSALPHDQQEARQYQASGTTLLTFSVCVLGGISCLKLSLLTYIIRSPVLAASINIGKAQKPTRHLQHPSFSPLQTMSSGGYANRLSEYNNKGVCGLPESFESSRSIKIKLGKLVELVKEAKTIVVLTGAGVSTSAGIPDFRGPKGIWTVEEEEKKAKDKEKRKRKRQKNSTKKGTKKQETAGDAKKTGSDYYETATTADVASTSKAKPQCDGGKVSEFYNSPSRAASSASAAKRKSVDDEGDVGDGGGSDNNGTSAATALKESTTPSFESARPTFTHRALTKLASLDIVKYVVTQNVDGLHRRSGLPRSKHAVLHGCVFTEKCERCGEEYFRDFDLGGVSFQKTGRQCTQKDCGGDLRDTILDWDDALPEDDWDRSQDECEAADLVLALGTSLRIEPAGSLPLRAKKFVIVNLQVTPLDDDATLIIKERVDKVMEHLLKELNIELDEDE